MEEKSNLYIVAIVGVVAVVAMVVLVLGAERGEKVARTSTLNTEDASGQAYVSVSGEWALCYQRSMAHDTRPANAIAICGPPTLNFG